MTSGITGWVLFGVFIVVMLALDLFVFHRRAHEVRVRESLLFSALWIGLAMAFNLWILLTRGPQPAMEFLTAYVVEESLSIDNLFVFLLLFRYFGVAPQYQHKVLFWGILGALVMRLVFIVTGVALLERLHWIEYVFGAILVWSGARMASHSEVEIEPEKSRVLKLFKRFFPISPRHEGDKFFVRDAGKLMATPLFVVLLMVETTDLIFAVDSIPAVLAISRDPFIIYTSNVFAILGLRTLFFALAGLMKLFHYLHYGLAAILVLVGLKMIVSAWVKIPIAYTLGAVALIIAGCTIASIVRPRVEEPIEPPAAPPLGGDGPAGP
jgi:tellurite resistance protein TerC